VDDNTNLILKGIELSSQGRYEEAILCFSSPSKGKDCPYTIDPNRNLIDIENIENV